MIILDARQLQRLADMLQQVERQQEAGGGEVHLAEEGLKEVAAGTGVDLEILRVATPDTLLGVLGPDGSGDPGRLWVAAEILYLDWIRARGADDGPTASDRRDKALLLYRTVDPELAIPEGSPPPEERIQTLETV